MTSTKKRSLTRRIVRRARKAGLEVYTRKEWGSQYYDVYSRRVNTHSHKLLPGKPSDTCVFHISVTNRTGFSTRNFFMDMRTVERIGYERFKSGISYNVGWCPRTGKIALGMPFAAKGTHTVNDKNVSGFSRDQNAVAIAVCMIGPVGIKPTKRALRRLRRFLAVCKAEGALTMGADFVPHSLFAYKDCPTDPLRNQLPMLKRWSTRLTKNKRV